MIPFNLFAFSYYLARFKDSFRQDTIDVMLGNPVSAESLLAMNDGQQLVEEDATEATEHARQLVEDCRRMLLGATELPMGSWGLINADPEYAHIRIKFSNNFYLSNIKTFPMKFPIVTG